MAGANQGGQRGQSVCLSEIRMVFGVLFGDENRQFFAENGFERDPPR